MTEDISDFLTRLRDILVKVGVSDRALKKLDWDTNFFQKSMLDSISLVAMAIEVEERFGIKIGTRDLDPGNFATPMKIKELVSRSGGR